MDRIEASKLIIRPVLTEKAAELREQNTYVFKVARDANKINIRKALEILFDVQVVSCNVMNVSGKKKRTRYKEGRTSAWKKAVVTLKEGQSFPFFEGA